MLNLENNFQVKCFEFRVKTVVEIVPIPVCIPPMSPSWGRLYCLLRNTCVWQLRVFILYTKEHLCLQIECFYIVYQGARVSDCWGCLYFILRSTCGTWSVSFYLCLKSVWPLLQHINCFTLHNGYWQNMKTSHTMAT